jgi:mannosyltransferase
MTRHFQTVARESSSVPQDEISDAPDEGRFTRRRSFYCIVLLTLTAAVLRISFLGSKSLWYDESLTEYRVTLPFVSLVKVLAHGQMNMGLYYLLLHGWTSFAGSSEFMLRLPSAIFAVATVPLVYALGVELRDRRTGLLAALLVTVNATCIRYAQNARSYSLMIALCTLAAFFYVRGVKRGGPASLLGYVVSATGSVYAHLFGVMALPAQWLSLFLFRPDKKTRIILTACIFTIGLLVVPAFFFAITGDHGNDSWVHRTSPAMVAHLPFLFAGEFDGRLSKLALLFTA